MNLDCDYREEAAMAMEMAAAAPSEAERLKWVRIALAWRELARLPHIDRGQFFLRDAPPSSA
jgi:hypothetical protein